MKLLTFLGVGRYEETEYHWQKRACRARFAPVAACHFLQPDHLVVFLTEEAQSQVYSDFCASLPPGLQIKPVPVPVGKNEQELWQIFERIAGAVDPGEEVAFDVTYGLRSFPLLALLAAVFLKSGLNVSLRAVLYGALDVGRQVSPGSTPMFDLSPMLSLLDWAVAADRFSRTGDARFLASLVRDQQRVLALAAAGDKDLLAEAGGLHHLAEALTHISQSLRLIRPRQAMEHVAGLQQRVERARPALQRAAAAQPFSLVLDGVIRAYRPLGYASPQEPEHLRQTLEVERVLVGWYAEKEQWVQAVTLAREWLLSWILLHVGPARVDDLNIRQRVERVLGAEAQDFLKAKETGHSFRPLFLRQIPDLEQILPLWLEISQVRNDIDHAGMRPDPGQPETLIRRIQKMVQAIEGLVLPPSRPVGPAFSGQD